MDGKTEIIPRKHRKSLAIAAVALLAPVTFGITWIIWRNWEKLEAFDLLLLASLPAMFAMAFVLDRIAKLPTLKRIGRRLPFSEGTKSQMWQMLPFGLFCMIAAAVIEANETPIYELAIRLLVAWLGLGLALEAWARGRAYLHGLKKGQ